MAQYERSTAVRADPQAAYDYLSDPRRMPQYIARMTQAEPSSDDHLRVAAEVQGRHEEGEATLRADPAARHLEWGAEGHDYHGSLTVAEGEDANGSTVTIRIRTHDDSDRAEIERVLDETVANIERALSTL